ncbi:hypothetical protein MMC18_006251 [Xylographa bjoerkii]|nr:hypothetical protein [Xylographa bjoerkii]
MPGGELGGELGAPVANAGQQDEDCLFLDLYVPGSVFRGHSSQLPVVVWFYGGAYIFGSKEAAAPYPYYNGTGMLQAANNGVIFVAGNYRLGAYGWLAGEYMEKMALPNAGLQDQRLLLQWVQDFIDLVGGDKTQVSAWGESAGAGSIVHHLIQYGGTQDPLFSKAILQSPAFEWQWNRSAGGTLDTIFKNFSRLAGCDDFDIACLQHTDQATLAIANQQLYNGSTPCTGLFPVGPSVDGKVIKELPVVALSKGNYWKKLDSIIVSHVAEESSLFVPKFIKTAADFDRFLYDFMPGSQLAATRAKISKQYPKPLLGTQQDRVRTLIRDSTFTCTTRQLYNAYKTKVSTYMLQYDFFAEYDLAIHGTDVLPTFFNTNVNMTAVFEDMLSKAGSKKVPGFILNDIGNIYKRFAPAYQSYFASHAVHGDPNTARKVAETVPWLPATDDGDHVTDVLRALYRYKLVGKDFDSRTEDKINTNTICNFWNDIGQEITMLMAEDGLAGSFRVQEELASNNFEL